MEVLTLANVLSFLFLGITTVEALGGKFWQITDIHLEEFYSSAGNVNNDCREIRNSTTTPNPIPGPYGDFNCDAPIRLVRNVVEEMKRIEPDPDFIVWTGDNVPHLEDDEIDWDLVFSTIRILTSEITSAFPNVLLVPIIGNHDVHPASGKFPWDSPVFQNFSDGYLTTGGWLSHIPNDQLDNFRKGGYYAVNVTSNLTILALNTFLYNKVYSDDDPKGQLVWIKQELEDARWNNVSVIITSHIPPGYGFPWDRLLTSPYQEDLVKILNEFSDVIITQLYGHLHQDTFRLFYDMNGEVKTHAFISPSVTPWKYPRNATTGNNPAIRLYRYNLQSKCITDYYQYSFNLSLANNEAEVNQSETKFWRLAYQATKLYGVDDLSTKSMREIYGKMVTDVDVFNDFVTFYQYGKTPECDLMCKGLHFCNIVSQTPHQWRDCIQNRNIVL